jgi:hypothetical protein
MTTLQYILGWRPRPRNGKIARLPQATRQLINQMIEDGIPYHAIIDKLKDSATPPPYAISEANLCNWRQGGYQDWRRTQQKNEVHKRLAAALSPVPRVRAVEPLGGKETETTFPDQSRPILSNPEQS